MSLLPFSNMWTADVAYMPRLDRAKSSKPTAGRLGAGHALAVTLLIIGVAAVAGPRPAAADPAAATNPGKTDGSAAETLAPAKRAYGQTSHVPGPPGSPAPPIADESEEQAPVWQPTKAQEAQLKQRVAARWDAVIERDFAKAYEYATPDYRKAHSARQYAGKFGSAIDWHVATVKRIRYDRPNEADVVVTIGYSFDLPGGDQPARTTGDVHERWVLDDGQWWRRDIQQPLGGGKQSGESPKK